MGFGGSSFIKTKAGKHLNLCAWKYGFIIRHPEGSEDITGISYEPWHIRYVGLPHSEIIEKGKLTLEEYIELLTPNKYFIANGYVIVRVSDNTETILVPKDFSKCTVSADNMGGVIITFELT